MILFPVECSKKKVLMLISITGWKLYIKKEKYLETGVFNLT